MADAELRELESRWRSTGSIEDEAAWLAAALRAGLAPQGETRLRAFLGGPAAREALGSDGSPARVEPSVVVAQALERFNQIGGVVEHALFEPPGEPDEQAAHELLARVMLATLGESPEVVGGPLEGQPIGLAALLGDHVDVSGRLLFNSPGGLLPAAGATASRAAGGGWGGGLRPGYGRAFSDPPYKLQTSLVEIAELFGAVWSGLVGSWEPGRVAAWSWNTESLPWFAAGHEWWGAPLWTIAPRDGRAWVAIAASATD